MSQRKIAIPIAVDELRSESADTELVTDEYSREEQGTELYRFIEPDHRGTYGPFDPWLLRNRFLDWKLTEWRSFFMMAGAFGEGTVTRNDFEDWQRLIRKSLLLQSREWKSLEGEFASVKVLRLRQSLIRFDFDVEPPAATLVGLSSLDSIIASVQLDKLQGAEFRVCARIDCNKPPFAVGTRQKIYCCSDCAHLVAVRNSRMKAAVVRSAGNRKPIKTTKRKAGK